MTMRDIQRYIETERTKLQDAIKLNTETREQEVNRRLKQRDEEWLAEMSRWHENWRKETKHFSPTLWTCIEYMCQWAKEEGEG